MNKVLLGVIAIGLCGCGPAWRPLRDYEASRSAYRTCIQAKGVPGCVNEKAILDADARAYAATSGQVLRVGPTD